VTAVAPWPQFSDHQILAARGAKNAVDPLCPYALSVEPECSAHGRVEDVATVFLTNRECPFRCLMCDLWRNTTDARVPQGAIPQQIDHALEQLPATRHIKLYNSGNFFDQQAIPPADYAAIAERVRSFDTVIVENHPRLCGDDCLRFRDLLPGQLEVALGLETVHEQVLARLNKRMTLDDFARAVRFLRDHDICVRTFILLRPPFLDEQQGIEWAVRSLQFAFDVGAQCCAVIPTRAGNGMLDQLAREGLFAAPCMTSLEQVLEAGLALQRGRVFVDLWDCERFYSCAACGTRRRDRLREMNLTQRVLPGITCDCSRSRL
jgi:archaeosine synthase beta-subunit